MDDAVLEDGDALLEEAIVDPRPQAEVYVSAAKTMLQLVVSKDFNTRHHLRAWWKTEGDHRKDYGLTKEQCDELLELCRVLAADLPEIAPPKSEHEEPKPQRRASKPSRRPAI